MGADRYTQRSSTNWLEMGYVAASWSVRHAIWLRNLLKSLEMMQEERVVIRVDNRSAIELAKNPVYHERSKHIDVRFHFIREKIKEGSVELEHVGTKQQIADIFTKPLPAVIFHEYRKLIGMKDKSI
ncbi:hypothetical protein LR48_Vigan10g177500 [Vigna angularis]|uniref:Copia protein n=2 Tax=Phaseolus angularis TaxID=3914 RepID=A0A0L9VLM2_PHAAN|nr:hypothetical protein LR48_Vigan10g177500 [Vigna angularis]